MRQKKSPAKVMYLDQFTSRKAVTLPEEGIGDLPDSLTAWIEYYVQLAIIGVRLPAVAHNYVK